MSGKRNKTTLLAETLGISVQDAKAFADEVNQVLSRQGGSPASFADIARTARDLLPKDRAAQTVAARLLQSSSDVRPSPTGTPPARPAATPPPPRHAASPPAPLQPAESARIEPGTIEYVQPHYLTLIIQGERVNCMRDRWPFNRQQPLAGMNVKIKYSPSTREVLEIFQFAMPVGLIIRPQTQPIPPSDGDKRHDGGMSGATPPPTPASSVQSKMPGEKTRQEQHREDADGRQSRRPQPAVWTRATLRRGEEKDTALRL